MKLNHLKIVNFRNIDFLDLLINNKNIIILGNNGEGKTNLLEAIYLLLTLRPIRTGRDYKPLIKHNEIFFNLKGIVESNNNQYELSLGFGKNKKSLLKNNNQVKPEEYLSKKAVIFFSPDETDQLVNSPDVRRKLLDRFIFSIYPEYYKILSEFKNLLKRRNALLKQTEDKILIGSIDKLFVELSYIISKKRLNFISEMQDFFKKNWSELKPQLPEINMYYKSFILKKNGADLLSLEDVKQIYKTNLERDIKQKNTTIGPHRDDLIFGLNDTPIKNFLSHGERKAAALAFNLGFAEFYYNKLNLNPLILLDDIKSEIDKPTFIRVINKINKSHSQVMITLLTKSDYDQIKDILIDVSLYEISSGTLIKLK